MTESTNVYGNWLVTVGRRDNAPVHGFTIQGSDQADGRHVPDSDDYQLTVSGQKWTVTLEQQSPINKIWKAQRIYDTMAFTPEGKLALRLDSHRPMPTEGPFNLIYYPGIELVCTSLDDDVSVVKPSDPYDFTLPKDGGRDTPPR